MTADLDLLHARARGDHAARLRLARAHAARGDLTDLRALAAEGDPNAVRQLAALESRDDPPS